MRQLRLFACAFVLILACDKVAITDVNARFILADATWFAAEETLFVFYRVNAEQGIGAETEIELGYRTDEEVQDFTPLEQLTPVHIHIPVDCGTLSRCGSYSVHVHLPPRDVQLQMRYRRGSALTLPAPLQFNRVDAGPAHSNRSLLVYGVFDETNTRVQWRARHVFPTLRNEEAQGLGLRRHFEITDAVFQSAVAFNTNNPYGYASRPRCKGDATPLDWALLATTDRAAFAPESMPLEASTSATVCADATVTDAKGTFQAIALARKNPETAPAFPLLRSPITTNRVIPFFLKLCNRELPDPFEAVLNQRLLLDGAPVI